MSITPIPVLLSVWAAFAAAGIAARHPVSAILANNAGLRVAVSRELTSMTPQTAATTMRSLNGVSTPQSEARAMALAVAAHAKDVPPGELSELLGAAAVGAASRLGENAQLMAQVRTALPFEDGEDIQELAKRLDRVFDNYGAKLGVPVEPVAGKESSGPAPLAPSVPRVDRMEVSGGKYTIYLKNPDGSETKAVELGRAKSWEEARKLARAQGQGYDLPTLDQARRLLSMAADPRFTLRGPNGEFAHPMWARADTDKGNEQLARQSLVVAMDFPGQPFFMKAGAEGVALYKAESARLKALLGTGLTQDREFELKQAEAMVAMFENGYPVFAVSTAKAAEKT